MMNKNDNHYIAIAFLQNSNFSFRLQHFNAWTPIYIQSSQEFDKKTQLGLCVHFYTELVIFTKIF